MIYVARIDDAFARFKLQRPIFSRYPLFLSLSVISFQYRTASAKNIIFPTPSPLFILFIPWTSSNPEQIFFFPPSSLLLSVNSTVINLITYREIIVCVTKDSFLLLRKKKKNSQSRENQRNRKSISWVISRKKGPEFTSILWRMDISPGGRPSSGNGARFNFQIIET